ncbi:MAG: hypothetical protein GY714_19215 [Desulfobacterales bacterium]|nr:hypothetical protein [Desulfobacterales bacterium]MCP4159760.1 hypothetical protein [Deltaproteobacteria bacterium]
MKSKIIYIDMDDVLCDYQSGYKYYKLKYPDIKFPQSIKGFFNDLAPVKNGVATVNKMISSEKYNPYILTAPSTRNPHSYMEKRIWIESHFDYNFTKKLIICPNKGLLKGDILIDDIVAGKGQESFEGDLIHFGSPEFPDWSSVSKILF